MSAPSPRTSPNLDRLSVIDEGGHRKKVYPADVRGWFSRNRKWSRWVLIAFGIALPWVQFNGKPVVLFDIPGRQFRLLWLHLNSQDVPLLFFGITGIGFVLIVTSALFGRVFCGWACPHTVVLEGLFRPIERLIEGPAAGARRLDAAKWDAKKMARKALKWVVFFAIAFVLAHTFLAYFVGGRTLVSWFVDDPREHWTVFLWAATATGVILFNFGWFREQMCLIICPYGRMQSALQDDDTIVVGYDMRRGEPRGKKAKKVDPDAAAKGDCVDCGRCVAVCPTGIDIRNGLQMECIGCAACVDACDDIMVKLDRPKGLVRYDSQRSLVGEVRKFIRPRLLYYAVAGFLGLGVAATMVGGRENLEANVIRVQAAPYEIVGDKLFNRMMIHVVDKSNDPRDLSLRTVAPKNVAVILPVPKVSLPALGSMRVPVVIQAPLNIGKGQHLQVIIEEKGKVVRTIDWEILGSSTKTGTQPPPTASPAIAPPATPPPAATTPPSATPTPPAATKPPAATTPPAATKPPEATK